MRAIEGVSSHPRWGPLFAGDLSAYNDDHSSADLALCGEFARRGLSAGAIDMAIRASELYREKWERDDYRERTIAKALASNSYSRSAQSFTIALEPLDPSEGKLSISTNEPSPRDWIVNGLLLPGKSAVLAGFGGVSKTQLAIQLAVAIVLGRPFMDRAVKSGSAMLILGEEDRAEIERRINAVVRRNQFSELEIALLHSRLLAFPFVGRDMRLTRSKALALEESEFGSEIIAAARKQPDLRLIVLDHMALAHGGDFNAREDAALTMRIVNSIAQETRAAVLVLAHTPKSAADNEASDANMVAGSTAFVDQSRGAWVMATMRTTEAKNFGVSSDQRSHFVSLTVVKNNYGPTGDVFWLERIRFDEVGLLQPIKLSLPVSPVKGSAAVAARLVETVRSHPGRYSRTKLRDSFSGKNGPLGASKASVDEAIDTCLEDGRLKMRSPTDEERKRYGLTGQVRFVLEAKLK